MKKFTFFIIIVLFPTLTFGEKSQSLGKITYLSGQAYVQAKDQEEWNELQLEMNIHDLDNIKTIDQSRCEITFQEKKVIRIDENSNINVTKEMEGVDKVTISKGDIWLSVQLSGLQSAIALETPSTACSIRGTVYRLTCDDNLSVYRCYQGEILVESAINKNTPKPENSFPVIKGEELVVVINFEEYKKKEENAFKEYYKKTKGDFEQFKKDQQQEFQEMIQKKWAEFKKMDGFYVRHFKFDEVKDMEVDWVKWNMERDKKMME